MKLLQTTILAVSVFGLASGAGAAQSRGDEVAVATEVLELTGEVDLAMLAIMDMMPLIEGNIRAVYPSLSARQYIMISEVYEEEFLNARDEFAAGMIDAYVESFSYEDLVGLRDFYLTDLGQRYTEALPELQESAADAGELVGFRVEQRASPRVRAIIIGEESEDK